MERLNRASQFLDVCADRRRDIFAGGGGDIGDRVGDGQGVEIELRQGDGRPSPPIDGAVQRLVQALLVLTGGTVGGRRVITHWPQQFPACHV